MNDTMTAPISADAEEFLLACCFIDGADVIARCLAAGIQKGDFDTPANGTIFQSMVGLASRREPTDAPTVAEDLRTRGLLEMVGGIPFLTQVSIRIPTTAHAGYFIEKVLWYAKQRRLRVCLAAAQEAAETPAPWPEIWEAVCPHLQAAQDAGANHSRRSLADVAARAEEWRTKPDNRPTTPTCWAGWDRVATAPRGGELIVIAGRPSTGKTTLAGNLADDVATRGQPVAFFSLEMGAEELVDRFAIRRAASRGVGWDRYENAAVSAQIRAIGTLKTLHIYEAEDAPSVSRIEATCRLLAAGPQGLGAIVIDYLQLVQPPAETKRENREQQVAAMSRRFKLLARAIGCPIFLLAQLNRESEKEERRPRLSDLRESGSIEQDADRVWFLYRPSPATGEPLPAEDIGVIDVVLYQGKCRNGPSGIEALLRFNRPTFNFLPA